MENLAKAILKVMQEVQGMEKNSRVGSGNSKYNGTKDQDVKEVFNKSMSDNGLCIMPIDYTEDTKVERWEEVDQWSKTIPKATKMKQSVFTKVNAKYLLLHESGESQVIAGYGHGVDSQDKGAGKATTYALKNALLYTFLTPVGKIDDTETTHSEDINIKQQTKPVDLPLITKEDFDSLKLPKNKKHIDWYLTNRKVTEDQRKELLKIKG